jgi:hypothetical protein
MGAALRKALEFFLGNGTTFIIKNWPTELIERPTEKQIHIEHKNALTQSARVRICDLYLNAKYFNDLPAPLHVIQSKEPLIRELVIEKKGEAVSVVVDTVRLWLAPKEPDARFYVEDEGPWIPKDLIIFFQDFIDSLSLANQSQATTTQDPTPSAGDGAALHFKPSANWKHSQVFQRVWSVVYEWLATFHDLSQMIKSSTLTVKNVSVSVRESASRGDDDDDESGVEADNAATAQQQHQKQQQQQQQQHSNDPSETHLNMLWDSFELMLRTDGGGPDDNGSSSKAMAAADAAAAAAAAKEQRKRDNKFFYRDSLTAVYKACVRSPRPLAPSHRRLLQCSPAPADHPLTHLVPEAAAAAAATANV